MNKIFLTATLMFFATNSIANDKEVLASLESNQGMIKIEQKNRMIMSDYKAYYSASRKQGQQKHSLTKQQYDQFLKIKKSL